MSSRANLNIGGVRALLAPSNIVIVGASDKPGSWSLKVRESLHRSGYPGPVFPVNPRIPTVWGGPCYPDIASLSSKPDHIVVLIPGAAAIAALQQAIKAGARSATIFASGFGEGGEEAGRQLGCRLRQVIEDAHIAVSGPNCLGNLAAPSRLLTIPDDRITEVLPGPAAIVGQSGGIITALYRALRSRGIGVGYALTTGNEIGLTTGDYIRYLVDDPGTKIIACFIEAIRRPEAFFEACRAAKAAGKPVVVLKIGGSDASRRAALAHTGSLAGSLECFDAVAQTAGIIRLNSVDEIVEATEYLSRTRPPRAPRVGAMVFSGGMKALMLEAADRTGVRFPSLSGATLDRLRKIIGVGTSLGNPLDAGFTGLTRADAYFACVDAMLDDPNIDVLVLQEELPNVPRKNSKVDNLGGIDRIAATSAKPIAILSMASYMMSPLAQAFHEQCPHLPFLHEVNKGMRAVAAVARYGGCLAAEDTPLTLPAAGGFPRQDILDRARTFGDGLSILNEALSKELLAEYGIMAPSEEIARSADAAVRAADRLGYPVVVKLLSDHVTHKSDIGGVFVNLQDAAAVRQAFGRIGANLAIHRPDLPYEGVLVATRISGGLELVLGVQRDPEVGPVVMFGAGGVLLELIKDVSFGPVPLNAVQAAEMIARTKIARLLRGFRGSTAYATDSVVSAIVALGRLAHELGPRIESIDVNPFVVLAHGAYALDGLVVLREAGQAMPPRTEHTHSA